MTASEPAGVRLGCFPHTSQDTIAQMQLQNPRGLQPCKETCSPAAPGLLCWGWCSYTETSRDMGTPGMAWEALVGWAQGGVGPLLPLFLWPSGFSTSSPPGTSRILTHTSREPSMAKQLCRAVGTGHSSQVHSTSVKGPGKGKHHPLTPPNPAAKTDTALADVPSPQKCLN